MVYHFYQVSHYNNVKHFFTIVTGPIWLDNIGCSSGDEILEDCSRLNWGSYHYYCDHSDDVGVVCRPSKTTTNDLVHYYSAHIATLTMYM